MNRTLVFRAVIFDLDGLVLDSETGYFAAWRLAAGRMGYELSQAFCESLSGLHGPVISQRLMEYFGADFDIDVFYRSSGDIWRERVRSQGIPVKSGFYLLMETIRELGLPYGLATNSRRVDAEQCLAWAGLGDVFPVIVCRDDVVNPKPAPDLYVKAAEHLGVDKGDCLVLEDSPVGIEAAVTAGCSCFFIPSCLTVDVRAAELADKVFSDLFQVADFVSASFNDPL